MTRTNPIPNATVPIIVSTSIGVTCGADEDQEGGQSQASESNRLQHTEWLALWGI